MSVNVCDHSDGIIRIYRSKNTNKEKVTSSSESFAKLY